MSFHVNVEIKSKCKNIDKVKAYLLENATDKKGVDRQIDTYFHSESGRLKLREGNIENSLIYYSRGDTLGPKQSDVNLVYVERDSGLRELLRKSNAIKVVVTKVRDIYFIDNVKFHLDQVEGLGHFIEIEAIDVDGSHSVDSLNVQCQKFVEKFELAEDDFINCSYSDLILERGQGFNEEFHTQATAFLKQTFRNIDDISFNVETYQLDHLCFRVTTQAEYVEYFNKLSLVADLLIESPVGGRMIATFRMHQPFSFEGRSIDLIELPQAKDNNKYALGFEHCEFVISETFEAIKEQYNYNFDEGGSNKEFNPELRIPFEDGTSIKLHHLALDKVIEIEQQD